MLEQLKLILQMTQVTSFAMSRVWRPGRATLAPAVKAASVEAMFAHAG
jgi:hypothetical protein